MAFEMVGSTIVIVYGATPPSDKEYLACLGELEKRARVITGALVYSLGGGPLKAAQRQAAARVWREAPHKPKVAVLTDSALVRGVFTAVAWIIGEQIKSLPCSDVAAAAEYLGESRAVLASVVARLCRTLEDTRDGQRP